MDLVREKVSDRRGLSLIEQLLHQGVLDNLKQWTPEEGTPQGAVISPLLANLYLNELDHTLAKAGFEVVRYADDFVILCRTRDDAERAETPSDGAAERLRHERGEIGRRSPEEHRRRVLQEPAGRQEGVGVHQGFTVKVKLPLVLWPSVDRACQATL